MKRILVFITVLSLLLLPVLSVGAESPDDEVFSFNTAAQVQKWKGENAGVFSSGVGRDGSGGLYMRDGYQMTYDKYTFLKGNIYFINYWAQCSKFIDEDDYLFAVTVGDTEIPARFTKVGQWVHSVKIIVPEEDISVISIKSKNCNAVIDDLSIKVVTSNDDRYVFESPSGASAWGGQFADGEGKFGTGAMKLISQSGTTSIRLPAENITNGMYVFGFSFKTKTEFKKPSESGAGHPKFFLRVLNNDSTRVGIASDGDGEWHTAMAVMPLSPTNKTLEFVFVNFEAAQEIFVDDIVVYRLDESDYMPDGTLGEQIEAMQADTDSEEKYVFKPIGETTGPDAADDVTDDETDNEPPILLLIGVFVLLAGSVVMTLLLTDDNGGKGKDEK